ncbi:MAG: hypothetical protein VYA34_14520 [Myxococcota bacterium]|nr:hypothetical protein [Myxococcota bacterium]
MLFLGFLLLSGCVLELPGSASPDAGLYFPTDLEASPDGRFLYVVNSNFDQRYQTAWLSVLDMDLLLSKPSGSEEVVAPGDVLGSRERGFGIRIMGLPGELALDRSGKRGAITHRGFNHLDESRVTFLDFADDGSTVSCGDPAFVGDLTLSEQATDCDEDHFLMIRVDGGDNRGGEAQDDVSKYAWENPYSLSFMEVSESEQLLGIGFLGVDSIYRQVIAERVRLYGVSDAGVEYKTSYEMSVAGVSSLVTVEDGSDRYMAVTSQLGAGVVSSVKIDESFLKGTNNVSLSDIQGDAGIQELVGMERSPRGDGYYILSKRPNALSFVKFSREIEVETGKQGLEDAPVSVLKADVFNTISLFGTPGDLVTWEADSGHEYVAISSFGRDLLQVFLRKGDGFELVYRTPVFGRDSDTGGVDEGPFALQLVHRQSRYFLAVTHFFEHALYLYEVTGAPDAFKLVYRIRDEDFESVGRFD